MTRYRHWVIVARDRPDLLEPLTCAFLKRPEYTVIVDRRDAGRRHSDRSYPTDRRFKDPELEPYAIVRRQDDD